MNGNELFDEWLKYKARSVKNAAEEDDGGRFFLGYVMGVAEAINDIWFERPNNITDDELCRMVGACLENHSPARYRLCPAHIAVMKPLRDAFPLDMDLLEYVRERNEMRKQLIKLTGGV